MKEIPILFSTPMVQAIMSGRKTQTRRIIKPQPIIDHDSGFVFDGKHKKQYCMHNWHDEFIDDFSRWMPGDIIWVRESFQFWDKLSGGGYAYKADFTQRYGAWERDTPKKFHDVERIEKWNPSIHMPKEAARVWLEITKITIEPLHDINEKDAKAEGFACISKDGGRTYKYGIPDNDGLPGVDNVGWPWQDWNTDPAKAFRTLWYKINGKESWNENPWVWVIEFKVLSTNGRPQLSPEIMTTNSK
jgi:hypothetical protein